MPRRSDGRGQGGPEPARRSVLVGRQQRLWTVLWNRAGRQHQGFDCSGLTLYAYAQVGTSLPHYTGAQYNDGTRVSRSQLGRPTPTRTMIRAAPTLPGTTRIRLPSAPPTCYDRPKVKVSHLHSNHSASRRTPLTWTDPPWTQPCVCEGAGRA
ncbi:C40 family peptidase [Actinomadura sp. CNU-125]|uniref:C40 family peptidase n=1 Tax=Actinomadura sp. CNU-125 TaxID=1904961 RepID=UPI002916877D|nr:NlpC/P60 family protein [Actinomadura sp. CNU-125]